MKYMQNQKIEKSKIALEEERILNFWNKSKTFEKSLEKASPLGDYTFYDGPPFATGTPHYGHIVTSLIKDAIPRFWTMQGYHVERKWGWDCHGLPVENIAEEKLNVNSKKEIEETIGVERFNKTCEEQINTYIAYWEKFIPRMGRWADMKNCYRTMDVDFMESVWWVFKEIWDKDLIYKSYRSMHVCTRCETTLSQSEVSEGYTDIKDISVTPKFKLVPEQKIGKNLISDDFTFILAWTTTPWTLIGNVALAVNENITYVLVESGNRYIVAKDKLKEVFKDKEYHEIKEFKGADLVNLKYEPLFDYYQNKDIDNKENGWKVYHGEFVNVEEGTGIVHIAPAFGEDDMLLGKINNLPFIQHVGMNGEFKKEVEDFKGMQVKSRGEESERLKADIEIIKHLAKIDRLHSKKKISHSYPHCWRCDTPLLNYATSSWFISVEKIKDQMLEEAKKINWSPEHIKKGRFGKWLEGARDWSISRQRYWASVMPIWECSCGEQVVFGSRSDLEKASGQAVNDLHKHVVDKITIECKKCKKTMHRVPDVLDTWFDSGSMPYAQAHYPFENKEKFDSNFPAEFIGEGVDQTRCWFYYLHTISTILKGSRAFTNAIVSGIVLAEDGKKMSKRLKNYPNPNELVDQYGADAIRYYLLSSPLMASEQLKFQEKDIGSILRSNMMILNNVVAFYSLFDDGEDYYQKYQEKEISHVLDSWITIRLKELMLEVTSNMESYNLIKAVRPIELFISDLSTWYLRRSRERFKGEDEEDKNNAQNTLAFVLVELSKLMAPFTPFIAEDIWQKILGHNFNNPSKSVHLENWPTQEGDISDSENNTISSMSEVRKIVELGLRARDKAGIKVRQPLNEITILNTDVDDSYKPLISEELNVRNVSIKKSDEREISVTLDTNITPELQLEGVKRELIRIINNLRKNAGLTISDGADVFYQTDSVLVKEVINWSTRDILKETMSKTIKDFMFKESDLDIEKEVVIAGEKVLVGIKKR